MSKQIENCNINIFKKKANEFLNKGNQPAGGLQLTTHASSADNDQVSYKLSFTNDSQAPKKDYEFEIIKGENEESIKKYIALRGFKEVQLIGEPQKALMNYGTGPNDERGIIFVQAIIYKKS